MKKELRIKKKKGFTLIELIVVIVILGVLALIVVPKIGGFTNDAAISSHNANVRTLQSAAMMYMAEKGQPASALDAAAAESALTPYVQEWPTVPKGIKNTTPAAGAKYTVTIATNGTVVVAPAIKATN